MTSSNIFHWPIISLSIISICLQLIADDRWIEFKTDFKKTNFYLETERIQNFTSFITTESYLNFSEESVDSVHKYPLKFIWMRANKTFYILQPYENMGDEHKSSKILEQIKNVKSEFQKFFYYWQFTAINSPINNIPDSAEIQYSSDSIMCSYLLEDSNDRKKILKIFSNKGLLKKLQISSNEQMFIIWPEYLKLEDKNICNGWRTRIFQDGIATQEIITRLEMETNGYYPLPVKVELEILKPEAALQRQLLVIFMRGYEFDLPLWELKASEEGMIKKMEE